MSRTPEGWSLTRSGRPENKVWFVRFTHAGQRVKRSTRETEVGRAKEAAAQIYAEVVSGRGWRGGPVPQTVLALDELLATWLVDQEPLLDELTVDQYMRYARAHFIPFFRTLAQITTSGAADYVRARLRCVRRKTVLKELSALRGFLGWCKEKGYVNEIPRIESPGRKATGRPDPKARYKKGVVELSSEEAEAILKCLPVRSRRNYPVRALYTVLWETGLRPATLAALRAPEDYKRGGRTLLIRDEADKARYGRVLPLSDAAKVALDEACPDVGLIFPWRDFRETLRKAATCAGLPVDKAKRVSNYDFRHARLTHLASNTNNLAGVAYLAGHKHVSTTARYVHGHEKAAEAVLAAVAAAARRADGSCG